MNMPLAFSALRHAGWQLSIHVLPALVQHLCQRAVYGHIVPPHQRDKAMRFLLLVALILSPSGLYAATKGNLENPQPDDYASGIYLISGWVCEASEVQILLNGSQYLDAPYGSDRQDTIPVCGDADNGFGVLVNMANLAPGEHEASLIADGHVLETVTFNTAPTAKEEFAIDLQGCAVAEGFPNADSETLLSWTTSMQGFQIEKESALWSHQLEGIWLADLAQISIWVFREECGPEAVFIHGDMSDNAGGSDLLKMTGMVDSPSFVISSTEGDGALREAILSIDSNEKIQLEFTACGPIDTQSCEFTPVNGRIIFTKVPNIMDPEGLGASGE